MGNISTFGAFTAIRLGIYAASQGISVTGNNISNVNTQGYTRQALNQRSIYISGQDRYVTKNDARIGYGALVTGVDQIRDPYLDIQYRTEIANVGAHDAKLAGLQRLSAIISEVYKGDDEDQGKGVIEASYNNILTQLQNLATRGAGQQEYDTLVRGSIEELCGQFKLYANELQTIYDNQVMGFKEDVDTTNTILTSIRNLNEQIRTANLYGSDALEMKDERNNLIDRLAELVRIDVTYVEENIGAGKSIDKLVIKLAGNDGVNRDANNATLIDGIYGTQLSIAQVQASDKYGHPLYQTDENGDLVLDENGKAIPVMQDSPNFDIILSALRDKRGVVMVTGREESPVTTTDTTDLANPKEVPLEFKSSQEAKDYIAAHPPQTVDGVRTSYEYTVTKEKAADKEFFKFPDNAPTVVEFSVKDDKGVETKFTEFDDKKSAQAALDKMKKAPYTSYEVKDNAGGKFQVMATQLPSHDQAQAKADELNLAQTKKDGSALEAGQTIEYIPVKKDGVWGVEGTITNATYSIIEVKENVSTDVALHDNTLYGALQAERELLTEKGEFSTAEEVLADPNATSKRGIQYYQLALDSLANKTAEVFNSANGYEKEFKNVTEKMEYFAETKAVKVKGAGGQDLYLQAAQKADGKWYYLTDDACVLKDKALLVGGDGKLPENQEATLTTEQYTHFNDPTDPNKNHAKELNLTADTYMNYGSVEKVTEWLDVNKPVWSKTQQAIDTGKGGILISNDEKKDDPEDINASNISISLGWSSGDTRIVQSFTSDNTTEQDNYQHLLSTFQNGSWDFAPADLGVDSYNKDVAFYKGTLQGMLTNINEVLANDQKVTDTMLQNYDTMANELWVSRDAVSGVDLNDEAMNLMQYQKAYQAACRVMTTFDSMLDKLINGT